MDKEPEVVLEADPLQQWFDHPVVRDVLETFNGQIDNVIDKPKG